MSVISVNDLEDAYHRWWTAKHAEGDTSPYATFMDAMVLGVRYERARRMRKSRSRTARRPTMPTHGYATCDVCGTMERCYRRMGKNGFYMRCGRCRVGGLTL